MLKNPEICRILTKVVKKWQAIQYPDQESNPEPLVRSEA
jgi:hypothetical protein